MPREQPVVLIVDDNDDTSDMYAAGLAHAGFRPVIAHNGSEGFTLAAETLPDVIITDVSLPGPLDGLALTRCLRDDKRTRRTPIIVVTGKVFDEDREEARQAGCDAFLTKPCLPDDLAAEVGRMLSTHAARSVDG